jgi:Ca-activated chloride channel homolog
MSMYPSHPRQPQRAPGDGGFASPIPGAAPGRLDVRTDRRLIRAAGGSERFVLVELCAPTPAPDPARRRTPVNLAFVLDRSGSMAGRGKLELAKQGVLEALDRLDPGDRFAIVAYDDHIDVVVGSTPASPEARHAAAGALRAIEARGSTNLADGWLRGAEQVATHLGAGSVDRVLLLTDGLANVGITDPAVLSGHAAELRARGIATSTIGVGEDFDESLLQAMADAGGGHFYFAGSLPEIRDHLTSEVGEALDVVARDVILTLTVPRARVRPLTPHPTETFGDQTRVRLGDLVAGQLARSVLRVGFPSGHDGTAVPATLSVAAAGALAGPSFAPRTLDWRFAGHAANDGQPRDRVVDRAVAELFAARARQEAVALNRRGDWQQARRSLEGVAERILGYAGEDAQLRDLASNLASEAPVAAAPMRESLRKSVHFAAANTARSRDASGKSRRA